MNRNFNISLKIKQSKTYEKKKLKKTFEQFNFLLGEPGETLDKLGFLIFLFKPHISWDKNNFFLRYHSILS